MNVFSRIMLCSVMGVLFSFRAAVGQSEVSPAPSSAEDALADILDLADEVAVEPAAPVPADAVDAPPAPAAPPAPVAPPVVDEKGASPALLAEPEWNVVDTRPAPGGADSLNALMKENLALRQQMERLEREKSEAQRAAAQWQGEVAELKKDVAEATRAVSAIKKTAPVKSDSEARVAVLESQLATAERARDELQRDLVNVRQRMAETAVPSAAAGAKVQPDSDLFRQLEKENVLLRKRLVETETDRQRITRRTGAIDETEQKLSDALAREKELQAKLDEAKFTEKRHRQAVVRLLDRLPQMEAELTELRKAVAEKDKALALRDQELKTARMDLQQREHRVAKAEQMGKLLQTTRDDVRRVSDKERRDLHYNMAAIYVRDGRFEDAEQEYLKALNYDPTDADTHYNLGILYDDELNDKRMAALHYKRYLKLNPQGPDAEAVKSWLMRIETDGF